MSSSPKDLQCDCEDFLINMLDKVCKFSGFTSLTYESR